MAKSRMRDRTTILFVRRVRRLILWADSIFGILFVAIQFSKLPFTGIVENGTTPVILWHGGLALYYVSWIAGVGFDLKIQEEVYEKIPTKRGSVPVHGIITVLVIIVVAAALLWTEKYIQKFALVLNCFIVLDHAAWIYIKWFLKEIISASKEEYIQNKLYYDLEKLNIVTQQIQGNWKWRRLIGTIPIVILINAFAFSSEFRSYLIALVKSLLPSLSDQHISSFISGILLLCFVLVAEIWHWIIRIKTRVASKMIEELSDKYELVP